MALTEEIFGILPEGFMASDSLMFDGLGGRNGFRLLGDLALLTYQGKERFGQSFNRIY